MNSLSLPTTMVQMPIGIFFIIFRQIPETLLLIQYENKLYLHVEMKQKVISTIILIHLNLFWVLLN